jgi:hypothetical protein
MRINVLVAPSCLCRILTVKVNTLDYKEFRINRHFSRNRLLYNENIYCVKIELEFIVIILVQLCRMETATGITVHITVIGPLMMYPADIAITALRRRFC